MDFATLIYEPKWQWWYLKAASLPTFNVCDSLNCMSWSFSKDVLAHVFLIAGLGPALLCCRNLLSGTSQPQHPFWSEKFGAVKEPFRRLDLHPTCLGVCTFQSIP